MYVCSDYMVEVEVEGHEGWYEEERGEVEAEGQKQNHEVEPVPARLQEKHLYTYIHTYIHKYTWNMWNNITNVR